MHFYPHFYSRQLECLLKTYVDWSPFTLNDHDHDFFMLNGNFYCTSVDEKQFSVNIQMDGNAKYHRSPEQYECLLNSLLI